MSNWFGVFWDTWRKLYNKTGIVFNWTILLPCRYVTEGKSTEGYQAIIRPLVEECREEVTFGDEDVEAVMNMAPYYPPDARCLVACIMNKLGMTREGKLVPPEELVIPYTRVFADEPERLKNPRDVVNNCYEEISKETYADPCDLGFQALICSVFKFYKTGNESTTAVTEQPVS